MLGYRGDADPGPRCTESPETVAIYESVDLVYVDSRHCNWAIGESYWYQFNKLWGSFDVSGYISLSLIGPHSTWQLDASRVCSRESSTEKMAVRGQQHETYTAERAYLRNF